MAGQDGTTPERRPSTRRGRAASLNLFHTRDMKFRLPSLDIQVIRDRLELRSTSGGLIRTIL